MPRLKSKFRSRIGADVCTSALVLVDTRLLRTDRSHCTRHHQWCCRHHTPHLGQVRHFHSWVAFLRLHQHSGHPHSDLRLKHPRLPHTCTRFRVHIAAWCSRDWGSANSLGRPTLSLYRQDCTTDRCSAHPQAACTRWLRRNIPVERNSTPALAGTCRLPAGRVGRTCESMRTLHLGHLC
jgi:hypothetical protein